MAGGSHDIYGANFTCFCNLYSGLYVGFYCRIEQVRNNFKLVLDFELMTET